MNKFYLQGKAEFSVDSESKLDGKAKGVVYTGAPIKRHGPFENLIIDLSTTTIAKSKIPLLKDHMTSQIAGHGQLSIKDNQLILEEGKLSSKTQAGKEIRELAEEGFEWEMSMGIFDFKIAEVEDETINGHYISKGFVFSGGIIREASFVPLGADMNTTVSVFNYNPKQEKSFMEFTQEQWAEFACACGGNKDATKEDVKKKFADNEKKIKELEDENKKLQEQFAAAQAEVEAKKTEERAAQIKEALSAKKIELAVEQVELASKTEESTKSLLSLIEGMKVEKQIDAKFAEKTIVSTEADTTKENPEALRLKAEALVAEGKAADFLEALNMLEGK